ncbi:unnamed protein product, partial [Darwinula stevensoni]
MEVGGGGRVMVGVGGAQIGALVELEGLDHPVGDICHGDEGLEEVSIIIAAGTNMTDFMASLNKRLSLPLIQALVCNIELTSDAMMEAHIEGTRHIKALNILKKRTEGKVGLVNNGIVATGPPKVKRLPGSPGALQKKLRETCEPVIGAMYIEEDVSRCPDLEPKYKCTLCDFQGFYDGMFRHILSLPHRTKFIEEVKEMKGESTPEAIAEMARDIEMEDGRSLSKIKVITGKESEHNKTEENESEIMGEKRKSSPDHQLAPEPKRHHGEPEQSSSIVTLDAKVEMKVRAASCSSQVGKGKDRMTAEDLISALKRIQVNDKKGSLLVTQLLSDFMRQLDKFFSKTQHISSVQYLKWIESEIQMQLEQQEKMLGLMKPKVPTVEVIEALKPKIGDTGSVTTATRTSTAWPPQPYAASMATAAAAIVLSQKEHRSSSNLTPIR